jgi:hypothetical protein
MKIERIECDCCGRRTNQALVSWDRRASHFQAVCPEDGINGGQWSMDVCFKCRKILHDVIRETVDGIRAKAAEEKRLQDGVRSRKDGW